MTPEDFPVRATGVVWADLDGGVILFEDVNVQHLSEPAAEIWRRMDGSTSLGYIAIVLADAYANEPQRVLADVLAFAERLRGHGLLVVQQTPRCRYTRSPVTAVVHDAGVVLLLDLRTGERLALSQTGMHVWTSLLQGFALDAAVNALHQQFPDAPPALATEVEGLVRELVERGLLVEST